MIQTKIIALVVLIAIATVGVIEIGIGNGIQSVHGQCNGGGGGQHDPDDCGHGKSLQHDTNGDSHSGHA